MRLFIILFSGFLMGTTVDRITEYILMSILFLLFFFYDLFFYFKKLDKTKQRKQFIFIELFFSILFLIILFIRKDSLIKEREIERNFNNSIVFFHEQNFDNRVFL